MNSSPREQLQWMISCVRNSHIAENSRYALRAILLRLNLILICSAAIHKTCTVMDARVINWHILKRV